MKTKVFDYPVSFHQGLMRILICPEFQVKVNPSLFGKQISCYILPFWLFLCFFSPFLHLIILIMSEAVTRDILWKKVYLYQSLFLIKLQPAACNIIRKRLWYRCFPVNFAKFLRTFFTKHLWATASITLLPLYKDRHLIKFIFELYVNYYTSVCCLDNFNWMYNLCKDIIKKKQVTWGRKQTSLLDTPWTQDVNWTYVRHSEDVLHVFWTSYVRSIYVLCPGVIKRVKWVRTYISLLDN